MTVDVIAPVEVSSASLEMRLEICASGMDVLLAKASAAVDPITPDATREALGAAVTEARELAEERDAWDGEIPRTAREVLLVAASIVRTRGWVQHTMEDSAGRVCAMGAILHAALRVEVWGIGMGLRPAASLQDEARVLLLERIRQDREWVASVPEWNDGPYGNRATLIHYLETEGRK